MQSSTRLKLKDETILECIEFNTGINGASEVMFVLVGDYFKIKPLLTKENLSYFEETENDIIIGTFNGYDTITNLSFVLNKEDEAKSTGKYHRRHDNGQHRSMVKRMGRGSFYSKNAVKDEL